MSLPDPSLHATDGPYESESAAAALRPRSIAMLLGGLLVAAVVALWLHAPTHSTAAVAPPYTVAGDAVSIATGSPSWRYVDVAEAALEEPLAEEPAPALVGFDEARATPVMAPLPGRVESVPLRLGDRVKQGDHLVLVRSPALVDLVKEVDVQRTQETAKKKIADRIASLVALRATPEKELGAAQAELEEARVAREASELKLRNLAIDADQQGTYWLTAPRSGVVVERHVAAGQEVGPDRTEPLLMIADLSEVVVTADLPEPSVGQLQGGGPATVFSPMSAQPMTGVVEYIGEVLDPERRMLTVRVRVPNPEHRLRPNAFVQVAFPAGAEKRVVVDAEAVVSDDQRSFVFVQTGDDRQTITRRPVTVGRRHEGKVEILDGLQPGDRYVARGAVLLLNAVDLAS